MPLAALEPLAWAVQRQHLQEPVLQHQVHQHLRRCSVHLEAWGPAAQQQDQEHQERQQQLRRLLLHGATWEQLASVHLVPAVLPAAARVHMAAAHLALVAVVHLVLLPAVHLLLQAVAAHLEQALARQLPLVPAVVQAARQLQAAHLVVPLVVSILEAAQHQQAVAASLAHPLSLLQLLVALDLAAQEQVLARQLALAPLLLAQALVHPHLLVVPLAHQQQAAVQQAVAVPLELPLALLRPLGSRRRAPQAARQLLMPLGRHPPLGRHLLGRWQLLHQQGLASPHRLEDRQLPLVPNLGLDSPPNLGRRRRPDLQALRLLQCLPLGSLLRQHQGLASLLRLGVVQLVEVCLGVGLVHSHRQQGVQAVSVPLDLVSMRLAQWLPAVPVVSSGVSTSSSSSSLNKAVSGRCVVECCGMPCM